MHLLHALCMLQCLYFIEHAINGNIYIYVVWVNLVWSALPNVFLLMKLVLSALPYVLMSAHHKFGIL